MSDKHHLLAHHFADLDQQHQAATLGMWTFLATELMFFGGLFTLYAVYRMAYLESFEQASNHLNLMLGGINTAVLLTSSLTIALAVHAAREGDRHLLTYLLLATAALGTLFLVIKGFEYAGDIADELMPGVAFDESHWARPNEVKLFLILYYLMTGIHAVHLVIGIGLMLVLAWMAWRGAFAPEGYAAIEAGGLYWHFVDVIWVFLLPLLYMVGVR